MSVTNSKSFLFLCFLSIPTSAFAAEISESTPMSFEECLSRKEAVVAQLRVNPSDIITVVNTNMVTITKLCTVDGSVLVTCSKPDKKMVITRSTDSCR